MKRHALIIALAFSLSTVPELAIASTPATIQQQRAPDPHKAAMRISRQLGLTGDQTAKLEPILAERQQKLQSLRADASLSESDRQQQMKATRQETRAEMKSVLTPDQMKQLKGMHRNHAGETAKPAGA